MAGGGLDPEYIQELFAGFGPVSIRRMFGSAGLFAEGRMFGLVSGGLVYLKANAGTIPDFEREKCAQFTYQTKNGMRSIPYWRLPERLYDDPDELEQWARRALAVASAVAARKVLARNPKPSAKTVRKKTSRKAPA